MRGCGGEPGNSREGKDLHLKSGREKQSRPRAWEKGIQKSIMLLWWSWGMCTEKGKGPRWGVFNKSL